MASNAAFKSSDLFSTSAFLRKAGLLATQKVWLPKLLYDCLPYFYLTAGFAAFFATLYISEWFWVLPHYLLFSGACLHLAYLVTRRRRSSEDCNDITCGTGD
ncbi:MAG TPA: hypothetical protein VFE85_01495 [Woeseiaceae bacterium]|nr:hypothetical protein [Woeseiaceae bacterium]